MANPKRLLSLHPPHLRRHPLTTQEAQDFRDPCPISNATAMGKFHLAPTYTLKT